MVVFWETLMYRFTKLVPSRVAGSIFRMLWLYFCCPFFLLIVRGSRIFVEHDELRMMRWVVAVILADIMCAFSVRVVLRNLDTQGTDPTAPFASSVLGLVAITYAKKQIVMSMESYSLLLALSVEHLDP